MSRFTKICAEIYCWIIVRFLKLYLFTLASPSVLNFWADLKNSVEERTFFLLFFFLQSNVLSVFRYGWFLHCSRKVVVVNGDRRHTWVPSVLCNKAWRYERMPSDETIAIDRGEISLWMLPVLEYLSSRHLLDYQHWETTSGRSLWIQHPVE